MTESWLSNEEVNNKRVAMEYVDMVLPAVVSVYCYSNTSYPFGESEQSSAIWQYEDAYFFNTAYILIFDI